MTIAKISLHYILNSGVLAGLKYLQSKSNKMLLWQCLGKQIDIQLTFANWHKINNVKEDQAENLTETLIFHKCL